MKSFKSPDGYKPTNNEEFMNEKMVNYFRLKLEFMRNKILSHTNENLKEGLTMLKEADPMDVSTEEELLYIELQTEAHQEKNLEEIDSALKRIHDGTYGYCAETGEPIQLDRLEIIPTAKYCFEVLKEKELDNGNTPI